MSASNGQRARFHRNRKRKILMRMKMREVMVELKTPAPEGARPAARPRSRQGPALESK
jgi:hypothetical protein